MASKLKKGDTVVVLSGKDRGREGQITAVYHKTGRAVVDGINMAVRHTKQSQSSQGGRIPTPLPIEVSNLAMKDPKHGGPTRVGFRFEDGKKVRYAKKSGDTIDA